MLNFICLLHSAVLNREGAKKINMKILCLQRDFNPRHATPRQVNQRFRPLGQDALMMISGLMSYKIVGYKLIKSLRDNGSQMYYGYMCIGTDCQTKSTFLISM